MPSGPYCSCSLKYPQNPNPGRIAKALIQNDRVNLVEPLLEPPIVSTMAPVLGFSG